MAEYDIYREKLAIKHPSYGHALWEPSPRKPDRPVQIGDVGFIRRGRFYPFFNALLPADDPSHELGVPEYYEPLVPTLSDHFDPSSLNRNHYCSAGVGVEPDPGYYSGPDDFQQVSFQYKGTRGAAVLSLPVAARREDTIALGDFKRWIVKHIDSWFAFARKLGLGIEQMEEIILVTGCDRARSWANIAFLGNHVDAQASFGVHVEGPDPRIDFQFSPENVRGAVLRHGPEGTNLPENQCVFIRGFRVARSFWLLPKRLKAAAGPSPDHPGGYDCDPDMEVLSIPAVTKYRDPLHLLLDYIAEQASDCDMVLAHDDDLVTIDGFGRDTSLGTLEPDVMMDLLQRSNIEIDKVLCDLSPTDRGPNADASVVKVAMVSMKLKNWDIGPQSQWLPHAGQSIDLGSASESRGSSPPPIPGSLPVSTIRGDTSKCESLLADHSDSAPSTLQDLFDSTLRRVGHAAEDILLGFGKTRISHSNVWQSLSSKFANVERHKLLSVVVVTCCAVSLFGWVFSFTWDIIFKLFITLFLASIPLSVWIEREYAYRRRLDDVYERLEALQHVVSLQLNPAEPAVVDNVRYNLPIMFRAVPENRDVFGQSSIQGIIRPAISEVDTNDVPEESIIALDDGGAEHRTRRPGPDIDSPIPTPSQHSPFSSNAIEYIPPVASAPRPPPTCSSSITTVPLPPFSTSSRPPTPVLPSQATDIPVHTLPPPADVPKRPRTSSFFNSIKNAFTPLPVP